MFSTASLNSTSLQKCHKHAVSLPVKDHLVLDLFFNLKSQKDEAHSLDSVLKDIECGQNYTPTRKQAGATTPGRSVGALCWK